MSEHVANHPETATHFEANTTSSGSVSNPSSASPPMEFSMRDYVDMKITVIDRKIDSEIKSLNGELSSRLSRVDHIPTTGGMFALILGAVVTGIAVLGVAYTIWGGGIGLGASLSSGISENRAAIEENASANDQTAKSLYQIQMSLDRLLQKAEPGLQD